MIRIHCDICGVDITEHLDRVLVGADTTRLFLDEKRVNEVNLCGCCHKQTKDNYKGGEIHYKSLASKLSGMQWLLLQLQLSGKLGMDALWAVRNGREDQACWCEFDRELNRFLDEAEKAETK